MNHPICTNCNMFVACVKQCHICLTNDITCVCWRKDQDTKEADRQT